MADYLITDENLLMEYREYIGCTPMSAYERKLLRKWVSEGHSVYESPGSKYFCTVYPPLSFLESYREDRKIAKALHGKSKKEQEQYLKEYMGWEEPVSQERTMEDARKHIHALEHELFYLWEFIGMNGLWSEAEAYLSANKDEPIPFEW